MPPRLLTTKRHKDIVKNTRKGIPLVVAAEATGITGRCAEYWMAKGRKAWDDWDSEDDPAVGTYAAFFREVTRSGAQWEIDKFETAMGGDQAGVGNGKGKSAQWALERTRGRRYQPKIQVQVENEMAMMIDVLEKVLPPEHYAAALAAMADLDDSGKPRILSGANTS